MDLPDFTPSEFYAADHEHLGAKTLKELYSLRSHVDTSLGNLREFRHIIENVIDRKVQEGQPTLFDEGKA